MGISTPGDLKHHLWRKLPPLRKFAVGRQLVNDITDATIAEFPAEILRHCAEESDREIVAREMLKTAKRHYCLEHGEDENNVGFVWTFIVSQLAMLLIQEILRWWLESKENQYLMDGWTKGVE